MSNTSLYNVSSVSSFLLMLSSVMTSFSVVWIVSKSSVSVGEFFGWVCC